MENGVFLGMIGGFFLAVLVLLGCDHASSGPLTSRQPTTEPLAQVAQAKIQQPVAQDIETQGKYINSASAAWLTW